MYRNSCFYYYFADNFQNYYGFTQYIDPLDHIHFLNHCNLIAVLCFSWISNFYFSWLNFCCICCQSDQILFARLFELFMHLMNCLPCFFQVRMKILFLVTKDIHFLNSTLCLRLPNKTNHFHYFQLALYISIDSAIYFTLWPASFFSLIDLIPSLS